MIKGRLDSEKSKFLNDCKLENVGMTYPGIFSLTQLAYGNQITNIDEAVQSYKKFIEVLKLEIKEANQINESPNPNTSN